MNSARTADRIARGGCVVRLLRPEPRRRQEWKNAGDAAGTPVVVEREHTSALPPETG